MSEVIIAIAGGGSVAKLPEDSVRWGTALGELVCGDDARNGGEHDDRETDD
jgi:hypothetical protein